MLTSNVEAEVEIESDIADHASYLTSSISTLQLDGFA